MADPVTPEAIRKAKLNLQLHANLGKGGYLFMYVCEPFPQLTVIKRRGSRSKPEERVMYIGEREIPWDLQVAADALTALQNAPEQACREIKTSTGGRDKVAKETAA